MSDNERMYEVKGRTGKKYLFTDEELYNRVIADSESNYNWIASATELVRVCNEPSFSEKYARGIKLRILNCFANLELQKEYPSRHLPTDNTAVELCYSSLNSTDEEVRKVKEKFLKNLIESIIKYDTDEVRLHIFSGKMYYKICDGWKKAKFDEYAPKSSINFSRLREELYKDFDRTIKKADEKGLLESFWHKERYPKE